ncbi:MAG TPA: tetratricopeptide repeat protein [Xanthobacteraceae bacterium]|nr:tetratricopeptide repeat protein [Xanthobacteraceae bacterium]
MLAERHRREGRLKEAAVLCGRILEVHPNTPEAEHLMGIVAHQSGMLGEAIEHVRRAVELAPRVALFHANLGEMLRVAGQPRRAVEEAQRALAIDPNMPAALNNLGIALFDQGKFDAALVQYERAIALQDDFAQAHSNRGNALQRLKRYAVAENAYRRAIELQPGFADGWNNLGTCLRQLKRPEEAETAYLRSLELWPNNPETLDNLALALKDLDRLEEAAELLRHALSMDQKNSKIHLHYGAVLLDQRKVEAAAAAVERAYQLDPNDHDCVNQMGRVAFARGDLEGSLRNYRRALALKPDLADAHNNMGNALKDLGRFREAEKAFRNSVRLDPTISGVYVNLADLKTFLPGDPLLLAMERLAARREDLTKTDRLQLDFALGKAYADLKDYDRSFAHLIRANAAKRTAVSYDEAATLSFFERIEAIFSGETIATKSGGGDPSSAPIFVIGMPRSGTTLVEQIIASHPKVFGAGELQTLNDVILTVRGADSTMAPYPEFVRTIDPSGVRRIGADYVARLRKVAPNGVRVTDKMPSNFFFAGLIHLALPNAKIIHCQRNPIDTCFSCFSKLFSGAQNHTYDLRELGRYYRGYEQLMSHWRRVLPAGRILDVQYEDVVADLEGEARRIIAYCRLDWDARCLHFHKTERPIRTASATQARKPIYRSAVDRRRVYEKHLGPLLEALGIKA